jgi:hypothetical protein
MSERRLRDTREQDVTVIDTAETRRVAERFGALTHWRCPKCNTLLAALRLMPGSVVEIKCYRCNALVKECA